MTERAMNRWRKRGAAVALLAALGAVAVVGPTPAGAAPPPAVPTADFCANVPDEEAFTDLTSNEDNINCLAFTEITLGLAGGTTYGPGGNVSRGQMASFIARMIDTANELEIDDLPELPATGPNAFTDDNGLAPHEANINRLAAADVVAGIGGGRFAPNQPVTRAQMATFINNAEDFLNGAEPRLTSAEDFFTDDELQTVHEPNINGLAGAGIVQGGPGGIAATLYGPEQPVNRSQMASFVIRYMALLESEGIIKPAGTPPTNQTIVVTPADEASLVNSTSAVDNTGRRAYEAVVTGDTETVDIVILPAEFVTNAEGQISFRDVDGTANRADVGATTAIIELTNGSSAAANTGYIDNVDVPASGTVTFAIDAIGADSVIPVVFVNEADNNAPVLALNADNKPTGGFGVGGRTNWVPPEAPNGDSVETVEVVNKDANYFVGATRTFFYDENDAFRVNGGADQTIAIFEGMLTPDDVIDVSYDRDEADQSIFNVTTDVVPPPTGLSVAMSDLDADGDPDDATLTWNASAQADARYNVYVDTVDDDTFVNADDTAVAQDLEVTTVTINNADTKTYTVGAEGGRSGRRSTGDLEKLATAPVDNAPQIRNNGAVVATNANPAGVTDDDVWVLYLTEGVTVAANASIQLTNAAGPVIERGAGATFELSDSGRTLTITLTQNPTAATAYPATIHAVGGIQDADEEGKNLGIANDPMLEDDGPEVLIDGFAGADRETTATVTFNEALLEVPAELEDNYTFTNVSGGAAVTLTDAVLSADGRTVTFTFSGALDATDTLLIEAGVLDANGAPLTPETLTVS